MTKNRKVEGFVLKRQNLGEADKIIVFFTQGEGKLQLIAKGVRKVGSKRAAHLEPFMLSRLSLHKGRNFDVITQADSAQSYLKNKTNLEKLATGFVFLEVIEKTIESGQASAETYSLLKEVMENLEDEKNPDFLQNYFLIKMLVTLGSQPDLSISSKGQKMFLDIENGVVATAANGNFSVEVSEQLLKLWRLIYGHDYKVISRVKVNEDLVDQSLQLVKSYFEYYFSRPFKTFSALQLSDQ